MVKVFRAVLLAILLNIAVAQADQKQIVYLVSSRPLGSFYSHPLSAQLATQTHNDVYAMYITLGYGDGGTSSEQLMHSVSEDIQRVDPSIVIIDEVDAAGYLQDGRGMVATLLSKVEKQCLETTAVETRAA